MRSSSSPFLFCRHCGSRYRSDKVDEHEKTCSQGTKSNRNSNEQKDLSSNIFLNNISSSSSLEKEFKTLLSDSELQNESENDQSGESDLSEPETFKLESIEKKKIEMLQTPYPPSSSHVSVGQKDSFQNSITKQQSFEKPGENPKQAWNANASRKLSGKVAPPQATKKYRHYPVSCEFCNKKFQPGEMKTHIQQQHPETLSPSIPQNEDTQKSSLSDGKKTPNKRKKSFVTRFRICYICGRQFGSKSISIHEPQCLKKWRIKNEQLPANKRMPEPVKPQTIPESNLTENTSGSRINVDQMPELNAENEAAYQSYLKSLVPCSFCSRRFNPDRVTVHENACIKRPKKRQYKTPDTANK